MKLPTKLDSELIDANPYWKYRCDRFRMPDGTEGRYYYVDSPGAVIVIPSASDGTLLLVRQARYLIGQLSLEFPGGSVGQAANPAIAARAELREETGWDAGHLDPIGSFASCKGMTNEICHVFSARDLSWQPARPDPTEQLELVRLSASEVDGAIQRGEIVDGMTITAWALWTRLRQAPS